MKVKYYAFYNDKISCITGCKKNGEWREISMVYYYILKIFGSRAIIKKEKG